MADEQLTGAFIPTTNIWDVSSISSMDVTSPEFKELIIRLYQNLNNMALSINIRDAGYYNLFPFVNGQLYFPNQSLDSQTSQTPQFRQVIRKVINFGALPNTTSKSVPHGIPINSQFTFTRIYGTASDTTGNTYIPIPYASPTLANNIELSVGARDVVITTGSSRTSFTFCYVVLEYLNQ